MPHECQTLIDLSKPRLTRSMGMNPTGTGITDIRTSSGCAFGRDEIPLITDIFARVADATGRDPATFENMQAVHYGVGEEYGRHWDYFHEGQPSSEAAMQVGGNRSGTFMAYLRSPDAGGETVFPDANGLRITAIAGDAVFFEYPLPIPFSRTLHAGMPVLAGEKDLINIFMRERAIR